MQHLLRPLPLADVRQHETEIAVGIRQKPIILGFFQIEDRLFQRLDAIGRLPIFLQQNQVGKVRVNAAEQERGAAVGDDFDGLLKIVARGFHFAFVEVKVAEQKIILRQRAPLSQRPMILQRRPQMIAGKLGFANGAINAPQHHVARSQVFGFLAFFCHGQRRFQIRNRARMIPHITLQRSQPQPHLKQRRRAEPSTCGSDFILRHHTQRLTIARQILQRFRQRTPHLRARFFGQQRTLRRQFKLRDRFVMAKLLSRALPGFD